MVRLGLIGAGKWGKNYIDAAKGSGVAEVVWACGKDWRNTARGKIDALIVATPPEPRAALIRELAEFGYPMMVEKPLCLSMADAEAIRVALQPDVPFLVNYQHLFSPRYLEIRERSNGLERRCRATAGGPEVRSYSQIWDYGPHFLAMTAGIGVPIESVTIELGVCEQKVFEWLVEEAGSFSTTRHFYNGRTERPLVHAVRAFAKAVKDGGTNDWRFGVEMSVAITCELERRSEEEFLRTAGSMANPTGSESMQEESHLPHPWNPNACDSSGRAHARDSARARSHHYRGYASADGGAVVHRGEAGVNRNPWHRNRLIRDAIYRAIEERMRADSTIMILGEGSEMKVHYDAPNIERDFSDRVLTLPITEDTNTNFAVGLAIAGLKPIVNVITADFMFRSMDSICNTVAKTAYCDKPRTIVIQAEFMTGGPTTGQRIEGLFARIPGLNVVVPSNPRDAYGLMLTALQTEAATVFFEDRMIEDEELELDEVDDVPTAVPFGRAYYQHQRGDVTVVSYGLTLHRLMQLGLRAHDLGVHFELIDLRTLYPLDVATVLRSVERTGKLLVVEPDVMFGGIGAELIAQVVAHGRPVRTERLGAPRATLPACRELHERYMPSDEDILEAIESLCR